MPTFQLKVAEYSFKMVKGRRKLQKPSERDGTLTEKTVEGSRVVLGSRPLSDLYVRDRLVPDEALAFEFDGTHLQLEVLKSLSGTFVDGMPVTGRGQLASGSKVEVGHSLVDVTIDHATSTCRLDVTVNHLQKFVYDYVDKAKPTRPFALHETGPQEHLWGRSPILRRSTWIAALVGAALLAAFPFVRNSEAMTRGELFHAHRIGAPDGPKDCAACHDPFSSNYDAKCVACHKGLDAKSSHPYERISSTHCNQCHPEHVGAHANVIPPMEKSASGWPQTCLRCHAGQPYPAEVSDATAAQIRPRVRDERGAPFARQLLVDGFAHKDHRIPKTSALAMTPGGAPLNSTAPVKCEECHKLLDAGKGERHAAIPTAEFAAVGYEKCLACHADWRVAVHGRDRDGAACYACHVKAEDPSKITSDLRTVLLPETNSKWVLMPREHDFKKDECQKCHVLEKSSKDHRTALGEKVFRHDHHLRTVAVERGQELALAQDCRACHDALAVSQTLSGTAVVNTTSCAKCHVDTVPTPVAVKEGATRKVVDMVHAIHTPDAATLSKSALRYASRDTLAQGCLSCHVPVAGAAPMTFREGAKDCKACHTGHENLGEGKCVLCHVDRTPAKNRELAGRLEFRFNEAGIFDRAKAVTKTTAAIATFDHESPGHSGHACSECHRESTVDRATRVLDVAWPAFDEDACVKCHVKERFHR